MSDEKHISDQARAAAEAAQETPDPEAPVELEISAEELKVMCREQLCPNCDIGAEAEDIRLRALAETENVKKRLIRETQELRKYAGQTILADLLPILDNLDLALDHADGVEACKDFVMGVEMTRKIFLETISKHGLTVVGELGEEFNPELHEAVGTAQNETLADNHVLQLLQKGYLLKGRLLRPAKVMVNKLSD